MAIPVLGAGILRCAWLVPLLVLSGCTGSGTTTAKADTLAVAPQALIDADHGAIKGLVLDPELSPVAGAQLLARPGDATTVSALDGGYVFSMLTPGMYTVFISKLGFKTPSVVVQVSANEVTTKDIAAVPIPIIKPRFEVIGPYSGYMQCYMATSLSSRYCGFAPVVGDPGNVEGSTVWTRDKNEVLFKLTGEDWEQIVFEAHWTASSAATNPKWQQVFSYKERASTHWFANSSASVSPNVYTVTKGVAGPGGQLPNGPSEPDQNLTLRSWMSLPFGRVSPSDVSPINLAYEMRYDTFVTVFYSQKAPKDYTAYKA